MFYRLKNKLFRMRFDYQIRDILKTPPMPVVDAPWHFVSMVAKSDIMMYLLSMKAFYRHFGAGKLSVIIDRATPEASRALLEQHFPGICFIVLEDIDPDPCQKGGTWERLVHMVRLSEHEYAVQVDCDTLATGVNLDEVKQCIKTNTSFTYADNHWCIKTLREIAADAREIDSPYVGIALERTFSDWHKADELKYVRASSGFAGFAKGGASMLLLEQFHADMKRALGPRWREWGTEQSGSNFVIANSLKAAVLPFPRYATFPLPTDNSQAKFFHFIGSNRFRKNYFAQQGRRIIADLLVS